MSEKTTQHHAFEHAFICKDKPIYGLEENTKALILGTIYPCKREECENPELEKPYKPPMEYIHASNIMNKIVKEITGYLSGSVSIFLIFSLLFLSFFDLVRVYFMHCNIF